MTILPDWFRHSPSAGNRFRESPDTFVWRYVLGNKDEFGGKAAVGSAVERTLAECLIVGEPMDGGTNLALSFYDEQTAGVVGPERDDIPALLERSIAALVPFGKPLTYQAPHALAAGERFGLRYPVKCLTDFGYEDFHVDLKCTWALPSKPKFDHVCQLATYWALTGKAQKLAYVTPKKHAVYDVPEADLEHGWRVMLATWKRIEAFDALCRSKADALAIIPLNPDSFRWSGADMQSVMQTWSI